MRAAPSSTNGWVSRDPRTSMHKLAGDGFLRFCHPDAAPG